MENSIIGPAVFASSWATSTSVFVQPGTTHYKVGLPILLMGRSSVQKLLRKRDKDILSGNITMLSSSSLDVWSTFMLCKIVCSSLS